MWLMVTLFLISAFLMVLSWGIRWRARARRAEMEAMLRELAHHECLSAAYDALMAVQRDLDQQSADANRQVAAIMLPPMSLN